MVVNNIACVLLSNGVIFGD